MRPLLLSALLLLSLPTGLALGQSVTLPKEVRGEPGAWIVVVPEKKDGGRVKWRVGPGLSRVPIDQLFPGQESAGVVVQGQRGTYEVWAWCAKGDVASELAVCRVVIGDVPPVPPGPVPPVPPGPVPPIPGDGLAVLIVYESAELAKLPEAQRGVIFGATVRDYLNRKCAPDPAVASWKRFRIWDKDLDLAAEHQLWRDAMARPRKSVPWIVVSNGKAGFEGPLPATVDEAMKLLRQFGGD